MAVSRFNYYAHNCDANEVIGESALALFGTSQTDLAFTSYVADHSVVGDITICQRMYFTGRTTYCNWLSWINPTNTVYPYTLFLGGNDLATLAFTHTGGSGQVSSTINVQRNRWVDVVIRASPSGNYVKFNIDNFYESKSRGTTNLGTTNTACRMMIGGLTGAAQVRQYYGYLRDIAIYPRCITDAEVLVYRGNGLPRGPVFYLPMREGAGLKFFDWSRFRNNLKLSGPSWSLNTSCNQDAFLWG